MAYNRIDPTRIKVLPLAQRRSYIDITKAAISPDAPVPDAGPLSGKIDDLAASIRAAKQRGSSVVLAYGAHLVKNGCCLLVNELLRGGWITHLSTQGAGIIHDWEFAYQGTSSESVADNAPVGRFGTWDETGATILQAAMEGARRGDGLGESLGRTIHEASRDDGKYAWMKYSITACAYERRVPLCVLPGIGYDIFACHPKFTADAGAALGRTATLDFHTLCHGVKNLMGGVYLSIGSAVTSPQSFEKAFSIANNLRDQDGEPFIKDHHLCVVDIQDGGGWDWGTKGEPPMDHPAYYLRWCKTFHRMAEGRGKLDYLQIDNRALLQNLVARMRG
jgi:hypothetical protein